MTVAAPRSLTDLRGDRAWSIRRLAEESGIATATIVRIEAGHDVRPASILRIAETIGVEPMAISEYVAQRQRQRDAQ